jgi:hypothetical protein
MKLQLAPFLVALQLLSLRAVAGPDAPVTAAIHTEAHGNCPFYVGLRRSSYGLRRQNTNDAWWAACAKTYAAQFPGAQPMILHILSNYQDDGTTQIEFKKPQSYTGSTENMSFLPRGKLNHERALTTYDQQSVKAVLQFEPGSATVDDCFKLAYATFHQHPSVIGLAIDGEWFRTKDSKDQTGVPITDADAKQWMELVSQLDPSYILILKHFDAPHLPPTYHNPHLWYLTDSQEFASQDDWLKEMRDWDVRFKDSSIGSQFGYPKDKKWWSKIPSPPLTMAHTLMDGSPDFRMILWVDFTAGTVQFGH